MRVLLITPSFPPDKGACPRHMQGIVDGLVQAGHQVLVLTALPHYPQGKIAPGFRGKWLHRDFFQGYEVWRCALLPSAAIRIFPRLLSVMTLFFSMLSHSRKIRAFAPEWVLVQSPPLPLALLGRWLAQENRAQFLLNISDLWPDVLAQMGVISRKNWLFRLAKKVELSLYKSADVVMAQSEESVAYIRRHIPDKQVLLYRVGILPDRYKHHPHRSGAPRRLIYFGLIGMAQGLEVICREIPFAALGVELHIFGDGPMRDKLAASLKGAPNEAVCRLHDAVDYTQIPALLSNFDGALIPQQQQLYGTVPSKLYEAMAAGLPIIFSGEGEAAKLVQEAACGWTAPAGDTEKLKHYISEFAAASDATLISLGTAGQAFACRQFHLDIQNKLLTATLSPANCLTV
ncbi:glycosyltransferase family 4 protein [Rhodoflexus sp.]